MASPLQSVASVSFSKTGRAIAGVAVTRLAATATAACESTALAFARTLEATLIMAARDASVGACAVTARSAMGWFAVWINAPKAGAHDLAGTGGCTRPIHARAGATVGPSRTGAITRAAVI